MYKTCAPSDGYYVIEKWGIMYVYILCYVIILTGKGVMINLFIKLHVTDVN